MLAFRVTTYLLLVLFLPHASFAYEPHLPEWVFEDFHLSSNIRVSTELRLSVCVCVCARAHACTCTPSLSHVRLFAAMHCSPPGSSGIFQARILKWLPFPTLGYLPCPGVKLRVSCLSCIGRQILYHCATWEARTVMT